MAMKGATMRFMTEVTAENIPYCKEIMVLRYFFLTKGVGRHKDHLGSFEMALRDALIQRFNLIAVSSIVPLGCKLVSLEKGAQMLKPGEIAFDQGTQRD